MKINHTTKVFIHENAFENIICKMATILSQLKCVNRYTIAVSQWGMTAAACLPRKCQFICDEIKHYPGEVVTMRSNTTLERLSRLECSPKKKQVLPWQPQSLSCLLYCLWMCYSEELFLSPLKSMMNTNSRKPENRRLPATCNAILICCTETEKCTLQK